LKGSSFHAPIAVLWSRTLICQTNRFLQALELRKVLLTRARVAGLDDGSGAACGAHGGGGIRPCRSLLPSRVRSPSPSLMPGPDRLLLDYSLTHPASCFMFGVEMNSTPSVSLLRACSHTLPFSHSLSLSHSLLLFLSLCLSFSLCLSVSLSLSSFSVLFSTFSPLFHTS